MTKIDPIIAVKDVEKSAKWYENIFGCKRKHGGDEFAVLVSENEEVLCAFINGERMNIQQ